MKTFDIKETSKFSKLTFKKLQRRAEGKERRERLQLEKQLDNLKPATPVKYAPDVAFHGVNLQPATPVKYAPDVAFHRGKPATSMLPTSHFTG